MKLDNLNDDTLRALRRHYNTMTNRFFSVQLFFLIIGFLFPPPLRLLSFVCSIATSVGVFICSKRTRAILNEEFRRL